MIDVLCQMSMMMISVLYQTVTQSSTLIVPDILNNSPQSRDAAPHIIVTMIQTVFVLFLLSCLFDGV